MTEYDWGFRILGNCASERRRVSWSDAFAGHANCDPSASVEREAYLSAFTFGVDFCRHLKDTGTTKGFDGICFASWLWLDIDREDDLPAALQDTLQLVAFLRERFDLKESAMLVFFSGSKGFHIGIPTALWSPEPSVKFHRVARQFCEGLATAAGVMIDTGVYDKVRAFRAPNSRHPKTGLHKRQFSRKELQELALNALLDLARNPKAFTIPPAVGPCEVAVADWKAAIVEVGREEQAVRQRHQTPQGTPSLNRRTMELIRSEVTVGERHRLLFSAAANLAEFDCPRPLAHALLTDAGLDLGLCPSDVKRQIDCGLNYRAPEGGAV